MQWSLSTLKKIIYNHLLLDFFKYKYVLLVLRSIMCISLKITSILKFGGKFFCKTQHWPFPLSGPSSWLYSTPYAHMVHVYGHAINKYLHCWVFSLICTMQKKTPGRKLNVVWCSCTNSNDMKFSIHLSPENKQNYITI